MTIKELIEHLKNYPEDTAVIFFNYDYGTTWRITGFLYDPKAKTLELCNDDQEG